MREFSGLSVLSSKCLLALMSLSHLHLWEIIKNPLSYFHAPIPSHKSSHSIHLGHKEGFPSPSKKRMFFEVIFNNSYQCCSYHCNLQTQHSTSLAMYFFSWITQHHWSSYRNVHACLCQRGASRSRSAALLYKSRIRAPGGLSEGCWQAQRSKLTRTEIGMCKMG